MVTNHIEAEYMTSSPPPIFKGGFTGSAIVQTETYPSCTIVSVRVLARALGLQNREYPPVRQRNALPEVCITRPD